MVTLIKEHSGLTQAAAQFVRVHCIVRPSPVSTKNTQVSPHPASTGRRLTCVFESSLAIVYQSNLCPSLIIAS